MDIMDLSTVSEILGIFGACRHASGLIRRSFLGSSGHRRVRLPLKQEKEVAARSFW